MVGHCNPLFHTLVHMPSSAITHHVMHDISLPLLVCVKAHIAFGLLGEAVTVAATVRQL